MTKKFLFPTLAIPSNAMPTSSGIGDAIISAPRNGIKNRNNLALKIERVLFAFGYEKR